MPTVISTVNGHEPTPASHLRPEEATATIFTRMEAHWPEDSAESDKAGMSFASRNACRKQCNDDVAAPGWGISLTYASSCAGGCSPHPDRGATTCVGRSCQHPGDAVVCVLHLQFCVPGLLLNQIIRPKRVISLSWRSKERGCTPSKINSTLQLP